jgi:AmmeMemoRadiSam system protein B
VPRRLGVIASIRRYSGSVIVFLAHYKPKSGVYKKDAALIQAILTLDIHVFYETLNKYKVSACGYGAIAATIVLRRVGKT